MNSCCSEKRCFPRAYQLCCAWKGLGFSWVLFEGDFCKHLGMREGVAAEVRNDVKICSCLKEHSSW